MVLEDLEQLVFNVDYGVSFAPIHGLKSGYELNKGFGTGKDLTAIVKVQFEEYRPQFRTMAISQSHSHNVVDPITCSGALIKSPKSETLREKYAG